MFRGKEGGKGQLCADLGRSIYSQGRPMQRPWGQNFLVSQRSSKKGYVAEEDLGEHGKDRDWNSKWGVHDVPCPGRAQ